jgi:hypothetical protein
MSEHEEQAGLFGDALAEIVHRGYVTHFTVMRYFAGDKEAAKKVDEALDKMAADPTETPDV